MGFLKKIFSNKPSSQDRAYTNSKSILKSPSRNHLEENNNESDKNFRPLLFGGK